MPDRRPLLPCGSLSWNCAAVLSQVKWYKFPHITLAQHKRRHFTCAHAPDDH